MKNKNPQKPKRFTQRIKVDGDLSFVSAFIIYKIRPGQVSIKALYDKLSLMRRIGKLFNFSMLCGVLFTITTAAQNAPPFEPNKREAHLIELTTLDNTIKLDIRYARTDNFTGKKVYPEARAFLQRPAAEGVVKVHQKLREKGLGLVIFDGYRPWSISKLFWETVIPEHKIFVADPAKGSKHNRGCAVDLSIFHLKTGKLLPMPSDFDEFTERASPEYTGGTEEERANRDMLRKLMEDAGFTVNPNEWWHFDHKDWESYAIYDISFAEAAAK